MIEPSAAPLTTAAPILDSPTLYIVPASETPEGKERLRAYYEALGRFVDFFSRVETAVTLMLRLYAKTSPEIAKVVFAGARIETGSTYIKQLAEATKVAKEQRDDLENVLQQLASLMAPQFDLALWRNLRGGRARYRIRCAEG